MDKTGGSPLRPRRATLADRARAIARLGLFSGGALRHVVQKVGLMTFGALYVSEPARRLRLASDRVGPSPAVRTALVAHAYYPDLIGEILRCRSFMPVGTPAFITVPPDRIDAARAAAGDAPDVTLVETTNRGRDIAPLMAVLRSGALEPFDAVLKIHTKRSPHLLDGETRRKLLFDMLCGSRRGVQRVLEMFLDPKTGIVGWGASYRSALPYWMDNRTRVEALALQLGVPGEPPLGFFEGSMFWFRPAALDGLLSLPLETEAFEVEAAQVDGTLHHAVERLFTIAAWARGYQVRDLEGRVLMEQGGLS